MTEEYMMADNVVPSFRIVMLFVSVCLAQIAAGTLLARADGFANLPVTAGCLTLYALSFWAMATMIASGTPLSLLLPLMSTVIPLTLVLIGVFVLGEPASLRKLMLLGLSCVLVGLAARA